MPDHERTTHTTSTPATAQASGSGSFFGPRRRPSLQLDPAQMEAILRQSEAPVRRWLDSNSGRVGSYNEGDLITLIRRNVPEAAGMGDGNLRGILRTWAQEHQVRIPPISLVPLGPQQAPAPAPAGGGLQWPRLDFSLGDFRVDIQLPSEAVARLPVRLGGRHRLSFRLSAEVSGSFSFSAVYDGIPHVRIGLRAGVSVSGRAPLSGGLFIESSEQVCQARNSAQLRESLQSAGNELRDAIRSAQESPTPRPGESGVDFAMRWAQVGIKIGALYEAIESARRNQCTNQPRFSVEFGVQTPLNPPDQPRERGDAPYLGGSATIRF